MVYINGKWRETKNKMDVINPATGKVLETISTVGGDETKEAIEAAKAAFALWKKKTGEERGAYLTEVVRLMEERKEALAQTITEENGKPISQSQSEVNQAIGQIQWYAEEAKRIYGDIIPATSNKKRMMVFYEPVGVSAAITPWNFPLSMITRKIGPAIAAGCTIVLKPAPETPLSAIRMFECFHEAGLPKGVANLVIGPAEPIGAELTSNPDVRKITFTGSTNVGKKLIRDSADTVKKVSMELGGHAPVVVFADADLDDAVEGVIASKFGNAGQTCISANRIYVEESILDAFVERLTKKVSMLNVGSGMEEETNIGPLINKAGLEKVINHVEDAVKQNGEVLCGGNQVENKESGGYFFEPTVIVGAHESMQIATEETFGPVAPIFTFKTEEEVIEKVNHDQYGLAGYCYTNDISRGFRMIEALEYGIIGINDAAPVAAQAPFGGLKESGIGKEGGKYGLDEYLEKKLASIQIK